MTDSNKYKHLTFDERLTIQEGLNAGLSFSKIGSQIGKHRTTVAKEVKRNAEVSNSSTNVINSDTVNNSCPMLCKAPFVCNPCKYRSRKCKYVKLLYNAKTAQKNYETLLKESREGIPLQEESFIVLMILSIQETKLFFCDPFQSSQKPYVEKNHTVLRDYIPKGTSLDDYTQDTIDLILSHMNSIARKSLNGKTPYEMFTFIFGAQLTDLLNIQKIEPENVIQSPVLIK